MTPLSAVVGSVFEKLLVGLGVWVLFVVFAWAVFAGIMLCHVKTAERPIPLFIAGLSIGVMLGFWLGVMV